MRGTTRLRLGLALGFMALFCRFAQAEADIGRIAQPYGLLYLTSYVAGLGTVRVTLARVAMVQPAAT